MATIKPLILHSHFNGPNPWKVVTILHDLDLPFENIIMDFQDLKKPPYEAINPNGRVPALQDPNTGVTVFESGACIDYLIETYDKQGVFAFENEQQKWAARSWRDFQMSGQGPYFGQRFWFANYHPEKIQSAIDRYANEAVRISKVIDSHLKAQGTDYLVSNKASYADLMFFPWYFSIDQIVPEGYDIAKELPVFQAWFDRVAARESVARMRKEKAEARENEMKKQAAKKANGQ